MSVTRNRYKQDPFEHISYRIAEIFFAIFVICEGIVIFLSCFDILFFDVKELTIYTLVLLVFSAIIAVRRFSSTRLGIKEFFLFKLYRYRELSGWISFIYSSIIACIISIVLRVGNYPSDRVPYYILGIFATLMVGIWALIISYNILHKQQQYILGFENFLEEIIVALKILSNEGEPTKEIIKHEVYIYDYYPLIGNVSSPGKFELYKEALDEVRRRKDINLQVISYHEECLKPFFDKLSISDETEIITITEDVRDYLIHFELGEGNRIHKHTSVWKTNEIGPFHFIIIDKLAYQYGVIPRENAPDTRHNIYGTKTEDIFTIDYLKQTFFDNKRNLLHPVDIKYSQKEDTFCFKFVGQSHISKIELYSDKQEKPFEVCYASDLDYREVWAEDRYLYREVQGLKVKDEKLINHPSFNFRFVKEDEDQSIHSKYIYYKDLLNYKPTDKIVKYIYPRQRGNLFNEFKNCVDLLKCEIESHKKYQIILKLTVFIEYNDVEDPYEYNQIINYLNNPVFKKLSNIPFNVVPQKPNENTNVVFELLISNDYNLQPENISYKKYKMLRYCKIEYDFGSEYFIGGIRSYFIDKYSLEAEIVQTFEAVKSLLIEEGLTFANIVRQWNYVGRIFDIISIDNKQMQCYQIFNHVREMFYKECDGFGEIGYPAATGVGINVNGFSMELMAVKFDNAEIKKIVDRIKVNPYEYSDKVLVGDHLDRYADKKARPLFERAKLVKAGKLKYYLISGTASIDGELTYMDPEKPLRSQVDKTIDSINNLLEDIESEFVLSIKNLSYIRVYYSKEIPFRKISNILDPIISDIPHIYLMADICRENLLFEIEGARF
jgi:enamine deaminase RidA (YjgF/YER057c/UK114 family)